MHRHQAGITLLEVMVVLAIVGVFATLSVVGFQGMIERQRVGGAQRELLMVAQDAHHKARSTLQAVRLRMWTTEEDGVDVTRVRWEALPCSNSWGSECPVAACQTAACGTGGCTCTELGEPVVIPRGLDAASLDGLCWLGTQDPGTPAAVMRTGGRDCDPDGVVPSGGELVLRRNMGTSEEPNWQRNVIMFVDGLTGAIRSVDCERAENPASIPGCVGG